MSKKGALGSLLVCALVLVMGLGGREARGEPMSCLGACRVDYGACLMETKGDPSVGVDARRAECGRAYLLCSAKCKEGTPAR
jgi:hypothetical protein